MEWTLYLSALSTCALNTSRITGKLPFEIIKQSLMSFGFEKNDEKARVLLLGKTSEKGEISFFEWLENIAKKTENYFSVWAVPAGAGFGASFFGDISAAGISIPAEKKSWSLQEERPPFYKITPKEFIDFIEVQKNPILFREIVLNSVSEYSRSNFGKTVSDSELNKFLFSPECPVFFEFNGESLWYDIREKYEQDDRRILLEGKWLELIYQRDDSYFKGKKTYGFRENTLRQTRFVFQESDFQQGQELILSDKEQLFQKAIEKIKLLAEKIESPFYDAFTTVLSILEISKKSKSLEEILNKTETTDRGKEIIRSKAGPLFILEKIGMHPQRTGQLLACEVSDVFGGMGSWNDQYIEPEFQKEFSTVSSELYNALYFFRLSSLQY